MLDRSGAGGRRMKKAVTLGQEKWQRKPGRIGPEGVAEADAAETEAKVHRQLPEEGNKGPGKGLGTRSWDVEKPHRESP